MESLLEKSRKKINSVSLDFKRYLYKKIHYQHRLISISGARGTGKTTLLLQIGALLDKKPVLYVALDDLFFTNNSLYSLSEEFVKIGGQLLLLDEVHKYPNWSREIKLIHDDFQDMQVFFTSSSILDLQYGESDLSRRVSKYVLHDMSFREYLAFHHNLNFASLTLDEIVKHHEDISLQLLEKFKPFKFFHNYLKFGSYPYFIGDEEDYYQKLLNTVNLVLDVDLPAIHKIDYEAIVKIKRLLYFLSVNVPFTPNISKLSEKLSINRNMLVQSIQLLEKAKMLHALYKQGRSISMLNKPDKIWLHNTNLIYAIGKSPDRGSLRETFFLNQVANNHEVSLAPKGDFLVDKKYVFEIGGKSKTRKQIQGVPNSYLVKDDMETGVMQSIPLWLFGFLY